MDTQVKLLVVRSAFQTQQVADFPAPFATPNAHSELSSIPTIIMHVVWLAGDMPGRH